MIAPRMTIAEYLDWCNAKAMADDLWQLRQARKRGACRNQLRVIAARMRLTYGRGITAESAVEIMEAAH